VLPEAVTRELRGLFSSVPPVPFEAIRTIVEDDLGVALDGVFAAVEEEPLGSASIAQIHRATTRDGEPVILKVVKPGIRELLYRDANLLDVVGRFLQMLIPRYQPRRVLEEFCDYTLREVDMVREGENSRTFAANFKDMPEVVFPRVYPELSGESVLCMAELVGIRPDSEAARALPSGERQRIIDVGASAIIRMLYEDGFFHADLHPGNLLILGDGRIGFIDLGMAGHLDPELRHSLLFQYYCLIIDDFDGAARHLSTVAQAGPRADVIGFRRAVKELSRRWRRAATFEDFSLALLILESLRLGARFQLYFPVELVLMVKALVTYEGVGYLLDPEFNVADVSERHINRIFRLQLSPLRLLRQGLRGAPDMVDALGKLPLLVSEAARALERQATRRPPRPLTGVRATLFGGSCLVAGSILVVFDGPWPLWVPLMLLGLLLPLRRGD
jgi:ubiquinone biosynthesis protein